jgi:hypothetical protein
MVQGSFQGIKPLNPNLNQFNSVHNLTAYPSGSRLFLFLLLHMDPMLLWRSRLPLKVFLLINDNYFSRFTTKIFKFLNIQ